MQALSYRSLNVRGRRPSEVATPTVTVASRRSFAVPQGQRRSCRIKPEMHSIASRLETSFISTTNSSSCVRATRSVERNTAGSTCVVCMMTASPASRPYLALMASSASWSTTKSAWVRFWSDCVRRSLTRRSMVSNAYRPVAEESEKEAMATCLPLRGGHSGAVRGGDRRVVSDASMRRACTRSFRFSRRRKVTSGTRAIERRRGVDPADLSASNQR